jgi:uncharacterized membrane protein
MSEPVREQLSQKLLSQGYGDLTPLQRSVIDLVVDEMPTGLRPGMKLDDRSLGERLADRVAAVGGSWGFISGFALALAIWMGWNVVMRGSVVGFDPYPFIFLNLMLSMLAAIQAPVIMMSQNRAAARDRIAAEHDYAVNLRAELEIMHLHDKLDALRVHEIAGLLRKQGEAIDSLRAEIVAKG